jgi:Uma2 family endonuclease
MTAAMSDLPPADGWTVDDLEALPEDGVRRVLLDGVLLVSPSPTDIHQIIAGCLMVALEESCPAEFQVTQGVEIRINSHRAFIPDVLVATDEAARRRTRLYLPLTRSPSARCIARSAGSTSRSTPWSPGRSSCRSRS